MSFETAVLARRFTIICLLALIFGILFAAFIENFARPARAFELGQLQACSLTGRISCAATK